MQNLVIIAALVALPLIWAVLIYNRLVARRQQTKEGWSGIDVQLKRRTNLIPNLVETVQTYASHERDILESVTELRHRAVVAEGEPAGARANLEDQLSGALMNLFAVAENYPDLKANQNYLALQESLNEIEDQIQMARRYYNGAVRNLNTLIDSFPSNLVAGPFGFRKANYYEVDSAADRTLPKVSQGKVT
ncbi:LemA family protein [Pelagibius litoralis]|uniref:LemA family protein n=1 Tax=Pelagibius litoralis TaxID=374515 RepID=A0A967EUW9_9PROT|nr:LemA family protein [Pelagibius litoralis]NIA67836.1 LemA family protein [Pelagibius litoralis]